MILNGVKFLAMVGLSDAFEACYTLVEHSYDYDGKIHSTNEITFYNGDFAYDLFHEDIEFKAKKMHTDDYNKVAWEIYSEFCQSNNIVLLTYEQMEELDRILLERK